jgi:hypothetical protein
MSEIISRIKESSCYKKFWQYIANPLCLISIFLLLILIPALFYYSGRPDSYQCKQTDFCELIRIKNALFFSLSKTLNTDIQNNYSQSFHIEILEIMQPLFWVILAGFIINAITASYSNKIREQVKEQVKEQELNKLQKQKERLEEFIENIIKELIPVTKIDNKEPLWKIDECLTFLNSLQHNPDSKNTKTLWPRVSSFINAVNNSYEISLALTPSAAAINLKNNNKDYFDTWLQIVSKLKEIHSQFNSKNFDFQKDFILSTGVINRALYITERLNTLKCIDIHNENKFIKSKETKDQTI